MIVVRNGFVAKPGEDHFRCPKQCVPFTVGWARCHATPRKVQHLLNLQGRGTLIVRLHLIVMNKMDKHFRELLEEYRVTLGFLSGLRVLYTATSPKVVEATKQLAKLEQALANYNEPNQSLKRAAG